MTTMDCAENETGLHHTGCLVATGSVEPRLLGRDPLMISLSGIPWTLFHGQIHWFGTHVQYEPKTMLLPGKDMT